MHAFELPESRGRFLDLPLHGVWIGESSILVRPLPLFNGLRSLLFIGECCFACSDIDITFLFLSGDFLNFDGDLHERESRFDWLVVSNVRRTLSSAVPVYY